MMGRKKCGTKLTKKVWGQFECCLVGMRSHLWPLNRTWYDFGYFRGKIIEQQQACRLDYKGRGESRFKRDDIHKTLLYAR